MCVCLLLVHRNRLVCLPFCRSEAAKYCPRNAANVCRRARKGGGGNLRLLPVWQVHQQSLWRDKDHESISIRVRFGVAHRQVRRTRESLFPLRMAQGSLMEIRPLQKLNRCYLEDIMWSVLLFSGGGRQKRQTQAAAHSALHEQTTELSNPWQRWWSMRTKHCAVATGGAFFPFPLPLPLYSWFAFIKPYGSSAEPDQNLQNASYLWPHFPPSHYLCFFSFM